MSKKVKTKPAWYITARRFIRRHTQCRFGIHWDVDYHDKVAMICGPHTCNDCGNYTPAIKWPKPPCNK